MSHDSSFVLVHSPSPGELERAVSERIEEGWWPLGTPFVHGERYIQAMVHDDFEDRSLQPAVGDS
ncbi:MAG: hypothetical protein MUE90_08595 [Thermoanaerobaculales bacterium]|jgi:hypothetical protein|nr:hypothetical protein [Thermoanaerobaculales bacterium]